MGIGVYLRWQGMTEEEGAAQQTGYSVVHGHVGYLREAYHGEPYATRMLVPEAFEPTPGANVDEEGAVRIPAWVLRNRLPAALSVARERALRVYGERLSTDAPEAPGLCRLRRASGATGGGGARAASARVLVRAAWELTQSGRQADADAGVARQRDSRSTR
jgi:hypothetical protein